MTLETPWPRCPDAAAFFEARLEDFTARNPPVAGLRDRFLQGAGVRLASLVDHWVLPEEPGLKDALRRTGVEERAAEDGEPVWLHPAARLPRVRLGAPGSPPVLCLAVEDLDQFLQANSLQANSLQTNGLGANGLGANGLRANGLEVSGRYGDPDSAYEEATIVLPGGMLAAAARRGYNGFQPGRLTSRDRENLARSRQALRNRGRQGDEASVVAETARLLAEIAMDCGPARSVDEFFAAEREFYLPRNRAAAWQYARQQKLGFGWANHDHHTYRCARETFQPLMQLFRQLGFVPREKFYAGAEAGWGAQILEHPISRIVIFADVDLAPAELDVDFAEAELPPQRELGTIGLWCALHGSSIARAGLHHLEAEFDYAACRAQFEEAGFPVMPAFTDLPMLKQAFTAAETWPVQPAAVGPLVEAGAITSGQAERFLQQGALGSHLEILQRWDGFKGFNKTGVSAIIRQTDSRRAPDESWRTKNEA